MGGGRDVAPPLAAVAATSLTLGFDRLRTRRLVSIAIDDDDPARATIPRRDGEVA